MKASTCAYLLTSATLITSLPQPNSYNGNDTGRLLLSRPNTGGLKLLSDKELALVVSAEMTDHVESVLLADVPVSKVEAGGTPCRESIRPEWRSLSTDARHAFISAVVCLTQAPPRGIWAPATTLWDEMTWLHLELGPQIHNNDIFLPWHRYYLYLLKIMLAEECQYTDPLPWWRETNDSGTNGDLVSSPLFTSDNLGTLTSASLEDDGTTRVCIGDGPFKGLQVRAAGVTECVARGERRQISSAVTVERQETCHTSPNSTYTQFGCCVEGSNHAFMHAAIGYTMGEVSISSSDPIFFLHHGYVDWQWKRWQNLRHERWTTITGCTDRRDPTAVCVNESEQCEKPLTKDTVLTSLGLIPDMTVADVLDSENSIMCFTYDDFSA